MWEVVVYAFTKATPDNSPGLRKIIEDRVSLMFGGKATLSKWRVKDDAVYYTIIVNYPESAAKAGIETRAIESVRWAYNAAFGNRVQVSSVGIESIKWKGLGIVSGVMESSEFQWVVLGLGSGLTTGILVLGLIKLIRG